ncbi:MAG: hypothetical protein Q9195_007427 [Heterodermia aff. obscurata]
MATIQPHQQRSPGHRATIGPNILSKMLQLERQSKVRCNPAPYRLTPLPGNDCLCHWEVWAQEVSALLKFVVKSKPADLHDSQQRRSYATGSGSPEEQKPLPFTPPTTLTAEAAPATTFPPSARPPPPTSFTRRSQTMPILQADMKASEKDKPSLTIDLAATRDGDAETSTIRSEICLSPSWSDHGEKERKKAKKLRDKEKKKREEEKKEAEKKLKKEEEKQKAAAAKASKRDGRLNKRPPPAAMDTQRMPTELRRNSFISFKSGQSSRETSRPSSRERRRMSGVSIGSSRSQQRSQSSPPTSTEIDGVAYDDWQPVVSTAAPQLPALHGISWNSRNGSSNGSKTNSWGSDASYAKELAQFTMVTNRLNRRSPNTSPQQASFNESSRHPDEAFAAARPLLRSQTDYNIATVSHDSPVVKEVERALADRRASSDRTVNNQPDVQRQQQSSSMTSQAPEMRRNTHIESPVTKASARESQSTAHRSEQKPNVNPLQSHPVQRSSLDGSSYVHRQRMYQQQRSLAGFQEEEAVRDANRTVEEETASPNGAETQPHFTPEAEHSKQESKPTLREQVTPPQDLHSSDEQNDQYHAFLRESQDMETAKKSQQQPASKMDRILGFGRRPKPVKQTSTATKKSAGSGGSETMVPSQLPSLEIPRQETNPMRPSKTERVLGDPQSSASPQTPKARSKLSRAVVDKEVSPKAKDRSPVQKGARASQAAAVIKQSPPRETDATQVQGQVSKPQATVENGRDVEQTQLVRSHSRTRTSSSQLLNDNISMVRAVSRSTTAPVLPTINLQPLQASSSDDLIAAAPSNKPTPPGSPTKVQALTNVRDTTPRVKGPRSPTRSKLPARIEPEVVIESVNSEGIVRKTSLKRPRSNPQLQSVTPTPPMPSLDFLPQLKHQPLTKPKPRSSFIPPKNPDGIRPPSNQFPVPAAVQANTIPNNHSAPNLAPGRSWGHHRQSGSSSETALTQMDPRRELGKRMSTLGPFSYAGAEKELDKPMAKMFVICCHCRFWHDLPSKIYAAMAVPKTLQREKGQLMMGGEAGREEAMLDTMVQCPWCNHAMSTACCAGWTAVVYLHERHH